MRTQVPDYFKNFKCIASKCEDTCCAGWEIVIDEETYDYYKSVTGEFGERLRSKITLDNEDHIFVLQGDNCPFLNKNKMCDIYSELGEERLCNTCKQYPRFIEEYGSLREVGLSLSCPEAARIILSDSKPIKFVFEEDDEMVSEYNEINYELFIQLMPSRNIAMNIIQDRSIELNIRLAIVLNFAKDIQDKIDTNNICSIEEIRNKYNDSNLIKKVIEDLQKYKNNNINKYENMIEYFKVYKNLSHINDECIKVLDYAIKYLQSTDNNSEKYADKHKLFNDYYFDNIYEYENLIVYFIFRYFMKSVYDYDLIAKIKLAVISYFIIKELNIIRWINNKYRLTKHDQIDIMHTYSKDIEHLDENLEKLAEMFEINEVFNLNNMILTLMN